jgi:hypothetical protein
MSALHSPHNACLEASNQPDSHSRWERLQISATCVFKALATVDPEVVPASVAVVMADHALKYCEDTPPSKRGEEEAKLVEHTLGVFDCEGVCVQLTPTQLLKLGIRYLQVWRALPPLCL